MFNIFNDFQYYFFKMLLYLQKYNAKLVMDDFR